MSAVGGAVGGVLADRIWPGPVPDDDDLTGWADYERAGEIDEQRAVLVAELTAAGGHLARAHRALQALTGRLYDVELAEGAAGRDVAEFLAVAARSVRAAAAVTARELGEPDRPEGSASCPALGDRR